MREIVMALPKRPKKEKGRRPHQKFFSPLPMNHDMGAVTEAEVGKIMASRDVKSAVMLQMRNRFLEDYTGMRTIRVRRPGLCILMSRTGSFPSSQAIPR